MLYAEWFSQFKHACGGYYTADEIAAIPDDEEFIRLCFEVGDTPEQAATLYLSY